MTQRCRSWAMLISLCTAPALTKQAVSLQQCDIQLLKSQEPQLHVAAQVLSEEVERRTGLKWQVTSALKATVCSITLRLGADGDVQLLKPEGFAISSAANSHLSLQVTGADARGVLFGVGYLLRHFEMRAGSVLLPDGLAAFATVQAPAYAVRGHQLGYRPKNNTFDGWSPEQFDQYIRDLAVFGTNTIELIPPRSDDDAISPLYTLPPLKMMQTLSRTIDRYGLNCSIWYPALDKDYADAATVAHAVAEWGEIFSALPRIDAVFVPGGDPGHTQPKYLFRLLEHVAAELHKTHPHAQMWVSPQSFSAAWLEEFYTLLAEHPAWLTGVVYGPEMRDSPEQFRKRVPAAYPIRFYPDITHTAAAQYPVPHWDPAFALTEGREPINPRPIDEGLLFHRYAPVTNGFVAYSEGSNDDVNKVLWSAWGWDPTQSASRILDEYARYFVGPDVAAAVSTGIQGLEQNWRGPIIENRSIPATLSSLESVAQLPAAHVETNWRLQQLLFRANYDGYLQQRAQRDGAQEHQALAALEAGDSPEALRRAITALPAVPTCSDSTLCRRASQLAEELFNTIRMQLSVFRFHALAADRGANLDTIDAAFDNLPWLREQLHEAEKAVDDAGRHQAIEHIIATLRQPSGVLRDNLGVPGLHVHLLSGSTFEQDPSGLSSVYEAADYTHTDAAKPLAQLTYAGTLYDLPLQMHYTGLNTQAVYHLHATFASNGSSVRLWVNRREFPLQCGAHKDCNEADVDLPADIADKGSLLLEWSVSQGLGGNGRNLRIRTVELRPGGNASSLLSPYSHQPAQTN